MEAIDSLRAAIAKLVRAKPRAVVAIDGMCAAGKSTLAGALARDLKAQVLRMDDFFLPPERKTPERLAEPGGNVDYERFKAQVLGPLKRGESIEYRRYDCGSGALCPPTILPPPALAIVEGVHSCHPYFGDAYDYRVFLRVDASIQRARILARNGEAMLKRFETEWIPMEHRYFEAFGIEEGCQITLTMS